MSAATLTPAELLSLHARFARSVALLDARPDLHVLGLDRDTDAVEAASSRLARFGDRARVVHGGFERMAALVEQHGYAGEILAFEGLPLEVIQQVVDDARAAGVRGNVHFSLTFIDDHGAVELPVRLELQPAMEIDARRMSLGKRRNGRRIGRAQVDRPGTPVAAMGAVHRPAHLVFGDRHPRCEARELRLV